MVQRTRLVLIGFQIKPARVRDVRIFYVPNKVRGVLNEFSHPFQLPERCKSC